MGNRGWVTVTRRGGEEVGGGGGGNEGLGRLRGRVERQELRWKGQTSEHWEKMESRKKMVSCMPVRRKKISRRQDALSRPVTVG